LKPSPKVNISRRRHVPRTGRRHRDYGFVVYVFIVVMILRIAL
jgi:hypothetical protein